MIIESQYEPLCIVCWNGDMGEVLFAKILQKGSQWPTKVHCFPFKQVSGRSGDHEWPRMTNAFILCDLVWKVQKRKLIQWSENEALNTFMWCKSGLPWAIW